MAYSDKVGSLQPPTQRRQFRQERPGVGTAVAHPMRRRHELQIKSIPRTGVIEDAKFQTFAVVAIATHLSHRDAEGQDRRSAWRLEYRNRQRLSLPRSKIHCSVSPRPIKAAPRLPRQERSPLSTLNVRLNWDPRFLLGSAFTLELFHHASINVTDKAVRRSAPRSPTRRHGGLRLGVGRGCSGLIINSSSTRGHADRPCLRFHGVQVFVDPKSMVYLRMTRITRISHAIGFAFDNPHAPRVAVAARRFRPSG